MPSLRALARDHRHLALTLVVLALLVKALVPTGFMISPSASTILTVSVCTDGVGEPRQMRIEVPRKSDHGSTTGNTTKGEHCAFSGLAKVATGGADPVLLAAAIAFILLVGTAPLRALPFRADPYLRPPLRGPPAAA